MTPVLLQAMFDSFEELVHELRAQLRTKEMLEVTAFEQKEAIKERDIEIDILKSDLENLKQQKEGLMKALG